ncbi:efflux RND transporter periplasmic adaptor subunit [Legionella pneumophila]|uniref:efflux RND transporter periplasmic adaptor subunit n=1 Tax=Legionella pneumophila TaxID=446 RepID=UPI000D07BDD4|nr:efflux RND transporter periplasmic adaptor subunit [Legionella pneumophila]HAT7073417.1 efflux RND transporter periplasmic adaptor subunit [Legionella pneumophila]HAU9810044.1 efflux RND transporter periplasmic adaptor subunit [Legionella pneumophila]HAU9905578.1 efflux RND transporter periplasmic adaptor subunit [Legionella pneumophila]HAU9927024.1 efflux RND transporter periplasmic adaptor subunit [Legionella pneumophila]HAU9930835.1 efflux RND transporter periplasmic adaptor subunit [Leg
MIHGHHHTHPKLRFIFLTSILFYSSFLIAHGDEIEVNTSGPAQSVTLTSEQTKMLGIEVSEATPRPMAELLTLNGQIQLLPNAQADVSVRISGAVTELVANLGDSVTKGQVLATVQSRLVGDPPPSVAVKAPISGVIDARNVNLGQAVEPNTVLFHISNREQLLAIVQVYEEDLGKIKAGQDVNVHVLSYPKRLFPGKITLIEPNLDALTRTVNVQISLDNKEGLLKPGMFVRANVILRLTKEALTIPNNAILDIDNATFVFVKNGTTYDRTVVSLGVRDDEYTEIKEGLVPGDAVVIQGNRELYTLSLSGGGTKKSGNKESH